MTGVQRFDAVVIGGGIFGCYAALYLAGRGRRVALLEKEQALFTKASVVNQARLHSGYHYPRSVATAAMSDEHKARFTEEHKDFVHFQFEKYYAIDRFGSFTDAAQFERFCQYLNIRCEQITRHPLFNFDRMEALYRTEEYTFDPILIREYYIKKNSTKYRYSAVYRGKNYPGSGSGQFLGYSFSGSRPAYSTPNAHGHQCDVRGRQRSQSTIWLRRTTIDA